MLYIVYALVEPVFEVVGLIVVLRCFRNGIKIVIHSRYTY